MTTPEDADLLKALGKILFGAVAAIVIGVAEIAEEIGEALATHRRKRLPPAPTNFRSIVQSQKGSIMPTITYTWDAPPATTDPALGVTATFLGYAVNGQPEITQTIDPTVTTFTTLALNNGDTVVGRLHFTNGNGDGPDATDTTTVAAGPAPGGMPPIPTNFRATVNP